MYIFSIISRSFSQVFNNHYHYQSSIVPVDGVGWISLGHCLYHASPFSLITCFLFHQSIFVYLILYSLLFPRLFRSSSTTAHFKFQSHFSSSHSLLAFSTFVSVFLYYHSLQISIPSSSHFHLLSSKHDLTTAY